MLLSKVMSPALRVVLMLAAVTAAVTPAPAATAGTDRSADRSRQPEPWRPWIQEEWVAPAGRYCAFPLRVHVVSQDVRVRVVDRYPDGAVRREEFAGPLVVDFVDDTTGRTTRQDAGGSGVAEYRPDGGWLRYTIVGPAGFGFRPGDRYPQGYYLLDGLHVITFDGDGTRRMAVALGNQDNVCQTLAGSA
ncbi:hypothetical protein C5N14_08890 [Micromonospora sp. MW-13]|uniref:hypothetical protein n=1 Tax=Micromonospora sp. MW-13 TaxID=2094022 RepID=UPI000E44D78C|nr:hypothetical protein [Micromonospora sp. MW-13]RGC69377.1 hypothetical protein C5N14_08890 [Micromonospora sp. MW-13]